MRHLTVLLADPLEERAAEVHTRLVLAGCEVVCCATVADVLERLNASGSSTGPTALLGHVVLADGPLLPALCRWSETTAGRLPRLLLWSVWGELDVPVHTPFLQRECGVVLPLPLDLDVLVRVLEVFSQQV